jgi:UDP-N-acetylglucosamine acyltransferase
MIHPTAIVHPSARLAKGAEVGPYCIVGENVSIGARTKLLAHVVVNGHTKIGEDCEIYPFSSLGMASQDRKSRGELVYTTIGDRTTLREYVSIHRATGEGQTTSVGNDCLLLAYVHIAHNCHIGNGVTMSNLAQLAGHVVVEDFANIGGMVGSHQFVRIGAYSMIGGATKLTRDVPPYFLVEGDPARVWGLNSVGLRRHGFSSETLSELKDCYKLLYRSGKNISQAVGDIKALVHTDAGLQLVAFLEAESERGILK